MKLNTKTAISTSKVLLVPYEGHHVAKYHGWMQDPAIQQATASEPLTLTEEYSNQRSWRLSSDKLTFIVCKPLDIHQRSEVDFIRMNTLDRMDRMVGDVNFFLHPYEADDDEGEGEGGERGEEKGWLKGEVDIMIADEDSRGAGMGSAAVKALLVYVRMQMGSLLEEYAMDTTRDGGAVEAAVLKGLMVKIQEGNDASRALFEKLGFKQEGSVNYFGEVKMVMDLEQLQSQSWWEPAVADWTQISYGGLADEAKHG